MRHLTSCDCIYSDLVVVLLLIIAGKHKAYKYFIASHLMFVEGLKCKSASLSSLIQLAIKRFDELSSSLFLCILLITFVGGGGEGG